MERKVVKTEKNWERELSPEQFHVLRKKGTEAPFSGKYNFTEDDGIYKCAGCGEPLFTSDSKFDAGCGWPSFFQPISNDKIKYETDKSQGMIRTEIMCSACGGHLGHVFEDGPEPTGQRYCVNSLSLDLEKKKD